MRMQHQRLRVGVIPLRNEERGRFSQTRGIQNRPSPLLSSIRGRGGAESDPGSVWRGGVPFSGRFLDKGGHGSLAWGSRCRRDCECKGRRAQANTAGWDQAWEGGMGALG